MNDDERYLLVVNPLPKWEDIPDRQKLGGPIGSFPQGFGRIKLADIKADAKAFFENLSAVFESVEGTLAQFELDEIEITAGLTIAGQLSPIGFAKGETEGSGMFRFVFRRKRFSAGPGDATEQEEDASTDEA